MKNSKINQELESIINLMGEHVSFLKNVKISGQFLSQKIEGKLTHIVLDLHGDYEFVHFSSFRGLWGVWGCSRANVHERTDVLRF